MTCDLHEIHRAIGSEEHQDIGRRMSWAKQATLDSLNKRYRMIDIGDITPGWYYTTNNEIETVVELLDDGGYRQHYRLDRISGKIEISSDVWDRQPNCGDIRNAVAIGKRRLNGATR